MKYAKLETNINSTLTETCMNSLAEPIEPKNSKLILARKRKCRFYRKTPKFGVGVYLLSVVVPRRCRFIYRRFTS